MSATNSDPSAASGASTPSARESPEPVHKDHFLQLMFSQASRGAYDTRGGLARPRASGAFTPLRNWRSQAGDHYELPTVVSGGPVRPDSPATEVMTDLRRVSAVTVDPSASVVDANRLMIARGVRALFVVDDARRVIGIITASDLLGERPMQFAQARGIRHDEVGVRDVMTPADRLEVLQLRDVVASRVGDIVATLRFAGRQHALVVDDQGEPGHNTICGMFSLTPIGRRLGLPAQQVHDIARTFAEIEALIASR